MDIARSVILMLALLLWRAAPGWVLPIETEAPLKTMSAHEYALHQERASEYRQEAQQLAQAIERYQIMERLYSIGSRGMSPGFNYSRRRDMVERVQRIIEYFAQKERDLEKRAAQEERWVQCGQPVRVS